MSRAIGRVLFAILFILGGVGKFFDVSKSVNYVKYVGYPVWGFEVADNVTTFLVYIAGALEVLGGLLLAIGAEELGAQLALAFLIPTTLLMHRPIGQPEDRAEIELISFLKNVSLVGALVYIYSSAVKQRLTPKVRTQ